MPPEPRAEDVGAVAALIVGANPRPGIAEAIRHRSARVRARHPELAA